MKKNDRLLKWIPAIVMLILAAATLVVYSITRVEKNPMIYLQVFVTALVPAAFPLIGMITKKEFPVFVSTLSAVHIFLASDLGSAFSFYDRIGAWDLLMHGYFGFVFSVIMFVLLLRWNGAGLKAPGFLILIFMTTAGAAALWEAWEFTCDTILGGDTQRVKEALANGTSPVADTMMDIIITFAGPVVLYILLYIDKRRGYRRSRAIYKLSSDGGGQ